MPRYSYHCDACNAEFDRVRPMRESAAAAECPAGHAGCRRTFHGVVMPAPARPSIAVY